MRIFQRLLNKISVMFPEEEWKKFYLDFLNERILPFWKNKDLYFFLSLSLQ